MHRVLQFACAFVLWAAATANAATGYMLRYASPYPPNHPFSRADQAWIQHVEQISGGRLRIKAFWGGTLVTSDSATLELEHGIADVALITPIYAHAGARLIKLQTGFYDGARTAQQQIAIYACLRRQFPVLDAELTGVHVLAVQGGELSHFMTRRRPIRDLSDLHGLRIRVPVELVPIMRNLGADPATMPMDQAYSALSKGIVDGVAAPADTLLSLHFAEVVPYFSAIEIPRGAYPARAISDRAWRKLPEDLQKLLTDSEGFWENQLNISISRAEQSGYKFGFSHGEQLVPASPALQAKFDQLYNNITRDNARSVGGAEGLAMFDATQREVAAIRAGHPPC